MHVSQLLGVEFDGDIYFPQKICFHQENPGLRKIKGCRHAVVAPPQPPKVADFLATNFYHQGL